MDRMQLELHHHHHHHHSTAAAFFARITSTPCGPSSVSFAKLSSAVHTIGLMSTPFTFGITRRVGDNNGSLLRNKHTHTHTHTHSSASWSSGRPRTRSRTSLIYSEQSVPLVCMRWTTAELFHRFRGTTSSLRIHTEESISQC